MLNERWAQALLHYKADLSAPSYPASESGHIGRAAIDGALVIYDPDDPPSWLREVLESRDDDGFTPEFWEDRAATFDTRVSDMDTELTLSPEGAPVPEDDEDDLTDHLTIAANPEIGLWVDHYDPEVTLEVTRVDPNTSRAYGTLNVGGRETEGYGLPISSLYSYYRRA